MRKDTGNHDIEIAINGKSSVTPSFKNISPIRRLSEYASGQYRKPTRKAALLSRNVKRTTVKMNLDNPVAAAMDIPRLDGLSVFRPPARLPPVYETQLSDLKEAVRGLESYNTRLKHQEHELYSFDSYEVKESAGKLRFKFSDKVKKQRCEWPYGESLISQAKKELSVEQKRNAEVEAAERNCIAPYIHKTSWKQDVIKKEFVKHRKVGLDTEFNLGSQQMDNEEDNTEIKEILRDATKIGGKSADTFLTK